ncbi:hypothetical protein [Prosthecobacter sp.]|uniref:hypothetical protein n=1 Tax=Prosthecobacter sp. TaxID=1965333 RepID=UPI0037842A19
MKTTMLFLMLATAVFSAEAPLLKDDFLVSDSAMRRAARGPWKFVEGSAVCTQDDALFKKNKDHGPILFYDLAYTDAFIHFAVKRDEANKMIIFTANGADGHVFRLVFTPAGMGVRAFPPEQKDHKSISLGNEKAVVLKPGAWTKVSVELRGTKATVKVGDFSKVYEHASIARAKTNLSVGFSYGTVSVTEMVVDK